jgi:YhcH/YjgK/YiaL family protein
MGEADMVVDQLSNASFYFGLGERLARGLRFLQAAGATTAPGRYPIDGELLFALFQEYNTKPRENGLWEAHRKYIDIQYVAQGFELMGYANLAQMRTEAYDEARDFVPVFGDGLFVPMPAGTFVIMTPQDAHMPQMAHAAPQPVRKIVIKVAV